MKRSKKVPSVNYIRNLLEALLGANYDDAFNHIESGTSNKAEINGSFVKGGEKLSKLLIYGTVVDTSFDMKRMSIRV